MADAEKIYGLKGKKAVVIGAGSIGVETSISFKRRGMEVCLIEQLGHVLPTVFDEEAASIVTKRIEDLGIKTYSGEKAIQFTGNGHVRSVVTDAREIQCDIVVLSVGIKPAIELARKAGIETGSLGGIKVSDQMMTNLPEIYAAGDVTETFDISRDTNWINAIWPCAVEQGRVAGWNMAGHKTLYEGSFRRNSIGNFIGVPAISMGVTHVATLIDLRQRDFKTRADVLEGVPGQPFFLFLDIQEDLDQGAPLAVIMIDDLFDLLQQ